VRPIRVTSPSSASPGAFARTATIAAALVAAFACAGCEVRGNMTALDDMQTVNTPDPVDAESHDASSTVTGRDAGADVVGASPYQGNPLCHASPSMSTSQCFPDIAATAKACNLAPDGGLYDPSAGYDMAVLACRVASDADGGSAMCTPAGSGKDGAMCSKPTDCAAGFECIDTGIAGTSPSCREYCCAGESECDSAHFCDIQSIVMRTKTKVPVCMPIDPSAGCTLLGSTCPDGETCSIVRANGATACVDVGQAMVGDECDDQHCARDLVCLGTPGQRRCFQLCMTAKPSAERCSTAQTCQSSLPLFPDPAIGFCH
jgi:hypothetical protein